MALGEEWCVEIYLGRTLISLVVKKKMVKLMQWLHLMWTLAVVSILLHRRDIVSRALFICVYQKNFRTPSIAHDE